jgi:hypothetical protein
MGMVAFEIAVVSKTNMAAMAAILEFRFRARLSVNILISGL